MAKQNLPEDEFDEFDERPLYKRNPLAFLAMLGAFGGVAAYLATRPPVEKMRVSKVEHVVSITLPPPPPPLPPPPPPPPVEVKEVVQEKVVDEPDTPPDSPADAAPSNDAPVAPGGVLPGGPRRVASIGGGHKKGKYDGFVLSTQKALVSAITRNSFTKTAALRCEASLWTDSTGRVTKAVLRNVSGDQNTAQSLDANVLQGLQLPEPPPNGMPMPINMRINIARPN